MSVDRPARVTAAGQGLLAPALYWAWLVVLAMCLVVASQDLGMLNQGDYRRAVGRFLEVWASVDGEGVNLQGVDWDFRADPGGPMTGGGSSSLLFWVATVVQRVVSDHYSTLAVAVVAKVGLVVVLERLAAVLAALVAWQLWGRALIASALLLSVFASHNIAFLNSFYMEFAFVLCLPVLLLGMASPTSRFSRSGVVIGAALCGAAKVQYFYLPMLVAVLMMWADRHDGRRLDRRLLLGLLFAQLLALLPLARGELRQLNYHHSTFMGSYLVLDAVERSALGIDAQAEACIGVDAWGNRLASAAADQMESRGHACGQGEHLSLRQVLAPYLAYPQVLLRLWQVAAPMHFSVRYFHVDAATLYVVKRGARGDALLALSRLRDAIWSPLLAWALPLVVLAFAPRASSRHGSVLWLPMGLLALFCLSQWVVALVGEGVRDLSRHWAGAQYSLDLLLVLVSVQLLVWLRRVVSSRAAASNGSAPG